GGGPVHSPRPVSHSLEGWWPAPIALPAGISPEGGDGRRPLDRGRGADAAFRRALRREERHELPPRPPGDRGGAPRAGAAPRRAVLGRRLCPCRFYPDKREEAGRRTWLCACDEMRRFKYCHCLLFVRPDGLPITEHLPEGHEGRVAWGPVADPASGSGGRR